MLAMADNKENTEPRSGFKAAEGGKPDATTADAIQEKQAQTQRLMNWWERGLGQAAATANPILSAIDPVQLADIISAGQGYHTILTLDRLDGLLRSADASPDPALEPLRRALRSGGGAKSQARAVGMLLFREALELFERSGGGGALPTPAAADPPVSLAEEIMLDEVWEQARLYVNSESYPDGAVIAVRAAPRKDAPMLKTFPQGSQFLATGSCGEYLQFRFVDGEVADGEITGYVPRVIGSLELLVPHSLPAPGPTLAPPGPPSPEKHALRPAAAAPHGLASPPPQSSPPHVQPTRAGASGARLEALEVRVSRMEALESRVVQQDYQIQTLQSELACLRGHLSRIAATFAPLTTAGSHAPQGW